MALTNCTINSGELSRTAGQAIGSENIRLTITPNAGYVVSASNFSNNSGSIPGVIAINISNSGTAGAIGNLVYVDVDLDNSYIMPSTNTDITIDIDGSATAAPISISGSYSTILTNSGSSQSNVTYSGSGGFGQTVLLFTKTISANANHFFATAPVYSITSGNASNYVISYTDTLDGSNRLISRNYSVSYIIQAQNESGHHIDFTAAAEEIYVVPIEITAYTLSTAPIPVSGITRTMRIFGSPGASFNLLVADQDDTDIINLTGQIIGSTGYNDVDITFPSATIDKVFTVTLTGDLASTFDTVNGQPSVITLYQSQDVTIEFTASHTDTSVIFTEAINSKTFPANSTISEADGSIIVNIEITSSNSLALLGQPSVSSFTNLDPSLNGGSDIVISSASLVNGNTPGSFTLVVGAVVFRAGSADVISNIDLSSLIYVSATSYCPTFSDFSPNLGNSINMDLIYPNIWGSDTIIYNGTEPASVTLKWYASGQSSYPGLPDPPYNNSYERQLNLTPGGTFTLTSGYINSAETDITVNAIGFTCGL